MLCSQRGSVLTITKGEKNTYSVLSSDCALLRHSWELFRVFNRQDVLEKKLPEMVWNKVCYSSFSHRGHWQWTITYIIIKITNSVLSRQTAYVKRKTREAGGKSQKKEKTQRYIYIYIFLLRRPCDFLLWWKLKMSFHQFFVYVYLQSYLLWGERQNNTWKK